MRPCSGQSLGRRGCNADCGATGTMDAEPHRPGFGRPNPKPDERGRIAAHLELSGGEVLVATTHCIDRYWKRAAAGCTRFADAEDRLKTLAAKIGTFAPAPAWAGAVRGRGLSLGPDVGLVVELRCAVTCLTRGSMPDQIRERRNARRQAQAVSRGDQRKDRRKGGRPRPEADS